MIYYKSCEANNMDKMIKYLKHDTNNVNVMIYNRQCNGQQ